MWHSILSVLACGTPAPPPQAAEREPQVAASTLHLPPDADSIPAGPFGDSVRRGREVFRDTPKNAPQFSGNNLSCKNCHIDDGRKANAAPIWAAFVSYPAYRSKNGHVNDFNERLQGCFTYSINAQASSAGAAPAPHDPMVVDLEAYAYWLATGLEVGGAPDGRGFPELERPEDVDAERGEMLYQQRCMACHGAQGQGINGPDGKAIFPPVWGEESFNWGAGMHRVNTAAGFIYANMPQGQEGTLSEQEAWDLALFIDSQPRPQDPRYTSGQAARDFHEHDCSFDENGPGQGT